MRLSRRALALLRIGSGGKEDCPLNRAIRVTVGSSILGTSCSSLTTHNPATHGDWEVEAPSWFPSFHPGPIVAAQSWALGPQ